MVAKSDRRQYMIFVINQDRFIFYLSLMPLLSRDNISLQVYHTGSEVQVTPPPGEFESTHYIFTYAEGEERLAREFLDQARLWNPRAQLREIFTVLVVSEDTHHGGHAPGRTGIWHLYPAPR